MRLPTTISPRREANHESPRRVETALTSPAAFVALTVLGAALRIGNYAANRSLWLDEAALAHNVVQRTFAGLATPLDYAQVAPLGFLWLEKIAVSVLGASEYALRLVPLLASLVALALFAIVARRLLAGIAAPFALALFAINIPLLFHSAETKQYSLDTAIALAVVLLALHARARPLSRARAAAIGVAGAIAPWVSQPSAFALGGAGLYLLTGAVRERGWRALRPLVLPLALWTIGVAAAAVAALHSVSAMERAYLDRFWMHAFLPLGDGIVPSAQWLGRSAGELFTWLYRSPAPLPWVLGALCVLGVRTFARRRDGTAALLLAPIALALVASALHLYPFAARLVIFAMPAVLLTIGAGMQQVVDWSPRPTLALALAGVLLAGAGLRLRELPFTREELRPVLEYVARERQPGDVIYAYYGAGQALTYYAPRVGIPESAYTIGPCARDDWRRYVASLDALRGHRVWLVLSHPFTKGGIQEDSLFVGYLNRIGQRLDAVTAPGAIAQLYDLRDTTRAIARARGYRAPASGDTSAIHESCFGTVGTMDRGTERPAPDPARVTGTR